MSKTNAKKFNPYKLINSTYFISNNFSGKWLPEEMFKNKKVLIVGPGKNILRNKSKIEKIVYKEKYYVIALNFFNSINEDLITLRVCCHPFRMISDLNKLKKTQSKIALPYSALNKNLRKKINLNKKSYLDYGLTLSNKKSIFIKKNFCVIPYPLAVAYALSIAISGKAKIIRMAGFDGYNKSDPDYDNTEEIFDIIVKKFIKRKILFLPKLNLSH